MSKRLYKTTLVVWTEFDPNRENYSITDIAEAVIENDAHVSKQETKRVDIPEDDPDWDEVARFDDEDEDADGLGTNDDRYGRSFGGDEDFEDNDNGYEKSPDEEF